MRVPLCWNSSGHSTDVSGFTFQMKTVDVQGAWPSLGNYLAYMAGCDFSQLGGGAGLGPTNGAWRQVSASFDSLSDHMNAGGAP